MVLSIAPCRCIYPAHPFDQMKLVMNNRKHLWKYVRTMTFILVGLMNTVWIKPEDIGSWKNYLGYFLLLLAILEVIFILLHFTKQKSIRKHA